MSEQGFDAKKFLHKYMHDAVLQGMKLGGMDSVADIIQAAYHQGLEDAARIASKHECSATENCGMYELCGGVIAAAIRRRGNE